ncbi:MAG: hypothetical protein QNJ90_13420 [Planctomycetota bacterium]|nr:hypothetical protein [Planctomycetota bacterium]
MRLCVCLVAVLLLLPACRGNRLPVPGAANAVRTPTPATRPAATPKVNYPTKFDVVRDKNVRLTPRALGPVDRWLKQPQWIIGETVDVYASREYFASMLTFNVRPGLVQKRETEFQGDTIITLTYVGASYATNAMRAPRVHIGGEQQRPDARGRPSTGVTVTARKAIRIRMAKTKDPSRPVQLRIVARGKAVHGKQDDVLRRGEQLEVSGALRRSNGIWWWIPVQR